MKKILTRTILVLWLAMFFGCGDDGGKGDPTPLPDTHKADTGGNDVQEPDTEADAQEDGSSDAQEDDISQDIEDTQADESTDTSVEAVFKFILPDKNEALDFHQLPFPCNLRLDSNGHIVIKEIPQLPGAVPSIVDAVRDSLNTLDGFGATTALFFPVEGDIDPATLQDNIHLLPLDNPASTPIPVVAAYNSTYNVIAFRPKVGHILLQGRTYGAWVTVGVKDQQGTDVKPAQEILDILNAQEKPSDPKLAHAYEVFKSLKERLDTDGTDLAGIVNATVFTVQTLTPILEKTRQKIRENTAPEIELLGYYPGPDGDLDVALGVSNGEVMGYDPGYFGDASIRHENIGFVIHGTFDAPYYLAEDLSAGGVGYIEYGPDGAAKPKSIQKMAFTLTLPKSESYTDIPVVLYQHGITRGRDDLFGIADELAKIGVAAIGIDLPFHGSRRIPFVDEVNNVTKEPVPDYVGDIIGMEGVYRLFALDGAGGFQKLDPIIIRDNQRQSQLDIMLLVHLLKNGTVDPLKAIEGLEDLSLNTSQIVMVAKSFGTFMSMVTTAVEPDIDAALMSVSTAGLLTPTLANSPVYGSDFLPIVMMVFGDDHKTVGPGKFPDNLHPVLAIMQTPVDSSDSLAFTPYLIEHPGPRDDKPVHILLQTCYSDEQVPNQASEALAAALKTPLLKHTGNTQGPRFVEMPELEPPLSMNISTPQGDVTVAFTYFTDSAHNMLTDQFEESLFEFGYPPIEPRTEPFEVQSDVAANQNQMIKYIKSFLETSQPVVGDPYTE